MTGAEWIALAGLGVGLLAGLISLIRKVQRLETEINNGVIARVTDIDHRLALLAVQVAEVHGWMRAVSSNTDGGSFRG